MLFAVDIQTGIIQTVAGDGTARGLRWRRRRSDERNPK
jgi:hypothetical protein